MLHIPLYLELGAVIIGSLSGALHAATKKTDAVGLLVLAISTGLGGGVIRDVLLGQLPPVALSRPNYLIVVFAAGLLALLLTSWLLRLTRAVDLIDAVLLGLWVVLGLEKALVLGLPPISALLLGLVTATAGSTIRDVLNGEPPGLVRPGEIRETAAVAAGLGYLLISEALHWPRFVAEAAAIGLACALRLLAITRHWQGPPVIDIPGRLPRRRKPA
jgi:uncharacterized membrane protein YeiH